LYNNITEVAEKQAVGRQKRLPKFTEHSDDSNNENSTSKPKLKKASAVRKARDGGDKILLRQEAGVSLIPTYPFESCKCILNVYAERHLRDTCIRVMKQHLDVNYFQMLLSAICLCNPLVGKHKIFYINYTKS
jgi:hypothetical protein